MSINEQFKGLDMYPLIGGPLHATITIKESNNMAMTKLNDEEFDSFTDKFNSLSFFMACLQEYINHNNLDPTGWKVVGFGTGTAYDSWHHQIVIESPAGMQKTIRVPMYKSANDNFLEHFINEV